ncbi:unnamed protein product, partial [Prorocentrum cordatum]
AASARGRAAEPSRGLHRIVRAGRLPSRWPARAAGAPLASRASRRRPPRRWSSASRSSALGPAGSRWPTTWRAGGAPASGQATPHGLRAAPSAGGAGRRGAAAEGRGPGGARRAGARRAAPLGGGARCVGPGGHARPARHAGRAGGARLLGRLKEQPGVVEVKTNTEVVDVRETADSVVLEYRPLLVLSGGTTWVKNTTRSGEHATFDMVVGADGNAPSSAVARSIVGQGCQAEPLPLLMMQAALPREAPCQGCQEELSVEGAVGARVEVAPAIGLASGSLGAGTAAQLQWWSVCSLTARLREPAMRSFPKPDAWGSTLSGYLLRATGMACALPRASWSTMWPGRATRRWGASTPGCPSTRTTWATGGRPPAGRWCWATRPT